MGFDIMFTRDVQRCMGGLATRRSIIPKQATPGLPEHILGLVLRAAGGDYGQKESGDCVRRGKGVIGLARGLLVGILRL